MLKAVLLLIGLDENSDFVKQYEAKMKPMTKEELVRQSEKALPSYRDGKHVEIEE